ncbi:SusC/RagA family TonB-linked outer membrane protein [Pedobacter sp. MC2016-14]|uniref:SusC/RagA family TonB-linked outer membrane protein n=1 Tax=Pedobacter sp. MC2016-14 TaxID=2897327 RepID=UPI001E48E740|nr:SusC/RagA family TonB-linked outer membrane protein [Pedobacter sp. MC2016-14]MCD0488641.1 SusC/RagA family TonB-linked outer membrane protein [Pedobacter sp. MC2016-14]
MQVSAAGYAQKISLNEKNAALEQIFNKIRLQSGYDFLFNRNLLKKAKAVDIYIKDASLQEALERSFSGQPFTFVIQEKTIIVKEKQPSILEKISSVFANIDVKGLLLDENGMPMPGATLTVKGSSRFVKTNDKGEFSLNNVDEEAILVITFLGYEKLEVKVEPNMAVAMKLASSKLQEVNITYNTGYQKISKERATGSFAKPDMEIFKKRTGSMDIMSRLDGLVPGLTIFNGPNNLDGNDEKGRTQKALVRGKGSVRTDTEPLYVVNGMRVENFSNINPDDVEDITVLKDAAAAAIWGIKSANGVIVVTTKSGAKEKKLNISYSGFVNIQGRPDRDYMRLMNSAQYIQTARELFSQSNYPAYSPFRFVAPHEQILYDGRIGNTRSITSAASAKLDSLAAIDNTSQLNELWSQNAITSNHTLSIGGGTELYSAYTSVSYTNDRSNRPGQKGETYRLNLNQTFNPTKYLTFTLFTGLNNSISKGDNAPTVPADVLPYQLFKDNQGNNLNLNYIQAIAAEDKADWEARSRINLDYNPLNERDFGFNDANRTAINVIGGVELKLFKGLVFQGNYGIQKSPGTTHNYNDYRSYSSRRQLLNLTVAPTIDDVPVYYLPTTGGTYSVGESTQKDWTVRNQLIYNSRVRDGKDYLSVQLGQEGNEQHGYSTISVLRGYDLDKQTYALLDYAALKRGIFPTVPGGRGGLAEAPFSTTDLVSRFASYFALLSYTFDGKYTLDGSWRVDRNTQVGGDAAVQDKPIWSVGGKWQIIKEPFMKNLTWLDDLGIRATYGMTGNAPASGANSSKDVLALENYNAIVGDGAYIDIPANRGLNWESTRTINIGINFSTLKSRLNGSIDLYDRNTTNLLATVLRNPFVGVKDATGNLGQLSNKGIELSLTSQNIQSNDFNWSTTFNFSYNYNKLVSYEVVPIELLSALGKVGSNYYVGHSMSSLFAYQYAGLDAAGDPMVRLNDGTVTKDRNVAQVDDIVYMGTTIPKFNGGLSNTFSYKDFSISANLSYNLGNVMRKETIDFFTGRLSGTEGSFSGNLSTLFLERWRNPGDELITNIPRYIANSSQSSQRELDYYSRGDANVVSAAYVKLRDISLSYSLPSNITRALHIGSARFFVQGTNFLVWAKNKDGIDPEYASLSGGGRSLPPFKHSFSLGTNISF